jgi:hypothetical protein
LNGTSRTGLPKKEQPERGIMNRAPRTGHKEQTIRQDNQNRISRSGQPELESITGRQNRTIRIGHQKKVSRKGKPEKDIKERPARKRHQYRAARLWYPKQDCQIG